jgi:hypothetical protein
MSEGSLRAFSAEAEIRGNLRIACEALLQHAAAVGGSQEEFISGLLCQVERAVREVRNNLGVKDKPDGDDIPEWLKGEELVS